MAPGPQRAHSLRRDVEGPTATGKDAMLRSRGTVALPLLKVRGQTCSNMVSDVSKG